MKRGFIYTAICLLLMQCCLLLPNEVKAGVEDKNARIDGAPLLALNPLSVTDDKFTNTAGWNNGMLNVTAINKIEFGIDESQRVFHSAFTSTINFSYTYIDEQLVTHGPFTESLTVTYNPLAGTAYQDKAVLNFSGGYKVDITINSLTTLDGTGNPVSNPGDLYLQAGISATRYYTFSQSIVPDITTMGYNLPAGANTMEVYWDVIPGAEEYDLEWTFVDNYDGTGGTIPASSLTYDFKNNATRVTTQNNYYNIPLIYESGIILFRVRGVGRSFVDVTKRLEGAWSSESSLINPTGIVADYPPQKQYTVTAHLDDNLNWSRVATFAEEGKQGNGITYMDGVLRAHQSVAALNSEQKTIVQSTLYDHNGRPAIGVLPAPVNRPDLTYNANMNMYSAGTPYDKSIFDVDNGCATTVPPMDNANSNGAAKYYSPNNPDKEGMQAVIPDAEGYPFVQVEYTPDMTGRIRRQTMPGSTHKMNSGKETRYYYAQPTQDELDRLFGSEAGNASHYKKNAAVDPNGQASVSYIDMRGNVIATALSGTKPDNLDPISGSTNSDQVSANLLIGNVSNDEEYSLSVNQTIFVASPSSSYTFNYEFTTEDFTDTCMPSLCFDCVYELELSITDECGNELIDLDGTGPQLPAAISVLVGGVDPYDTNCDNPAITYTLPNNPLTIIFSAVGEYFIHKKLKVSEDPIPYYLEQYLANNTCIQTLQDFEQAALATLDFSGCDYTCEQCTTALQAYVDKTTPGHPTYDPSLAPLTADHYAALLADCQELCEPPDACTALKGIMLQDMFPGQQYATYTVGVSGYSSTDPVSIFTTGNDLGIQWNSSGLNYTDANGNPALVTNSAGQAVSPDQLTMEEFIQMFQPSWAEALLSYHPEYCYYQFCNANSSSESYDIAMMATMSYDEACNAGYLEPLPQLAWGACPQVTDPFFATGGFGSADQLTFAGMLLNYNGGLSIYELAVQLVTGSASTHTFGSDPCTKDAEWKAFRAFYLTKKLEYVNKYRMDYAMQNGCYNGCIGNAAFNAADDDFNCYNLNITPACLSQPSNYSGMLDGDQPCSSFSYYANKQKRFVSPSQAFGFDPFTGSPSASQTDFDAVNCQPTCEGYADQILITLSSCGMTPTQYTDIRNGLIAVCMGGCDENNPLGASTSPTPVGSGSFTSFQDVLTYYLGSNGNTMDCNALMISTPKPYVDPATAANPPYPVLDTCGCDKILTNSDKFTELQLSGTLPDGVDTEEELFEYIYGFSVIDYSGMECKCRSVADVAWTPEYIWTSTDAADLKAYNLPVPEGMQCEYCLPCSEVTYAYNAFLTSHPGWESSPSFTTMLTTHMNNSLGMTLSYLDYVDFLNACEEFQAGQELCSDHLTGTAISFQQFLEAVAAAGMLTSSYTMTPMNTPSFFNSNLYPYNGTQVSYSASMSGNTLTVTLSDYTQKPPFECQFSLSFPAGTNYNFDNITDFSNIASNLGSGECGWQHNFTITAHLTVEGRLIEVEMTGTTCYNIVDCSCDGSPRLCNRKTLTVQAENDCMQSLIDQALTDAQEKYDTYLQGVIYSFINDYKAKCFAIQHEEFDMDYSLNEYHYTLYYYDRAGNLTKTVPPNGVTVLNSTQVDQVQYVRANGGTRVYTNNSASLGYITTYKYNTYNQATENSVPDEDGATVYFYDKIGRIVASQNHKQLVSGDVYSYTLYDELSRITEVGEITATTTLTTTIAEDDAAWASFVSGGSKIQVTKTFYDEALVTIPFGSNGPEHLRNRVASVTFQKVWNASPTVYDQATHYSYDEHGNANHIIQDNQQLAHFGQQYKHIKYEYDLVSGNVMQVSYQEDEPDQFYHKYVYDADNRLTEVYTSRDGELWEKDAKYFFQQQGALGRVELGDAQVQGMDFAYTIQGWIKGMNSNILSSNNDMGKDGATGNSYISTLNDVHANFGEDVAGFSLSYFNNDYKSIQSFAAADNFLASTAGVTGTGNGFDLASDAPELFNGNISSMVISILDPTTRNKLPQLTAYKYDQLNRLTQMKAYSDITSNVWDNGASYNDSYYMSLTYDPNGNIQTMTRKGAGGTGMDVLTYKYITQANGFGMNRNQLNHVDDAVVGSAYTDDLEDQNLQNYDYDEIGQLAKDDAECIADIQWTPYRKVKRVVRTNGCQVNGTYPPDLEFDYNAQQQRIMKLVKPRDGSGNLLSEDQWEYTYYSYDAAGNVLAIYERKYTSTGAGAWEDQLKVKAFELYGSSHVGTYGYTNAYQVAAVPFTATLTGNTFTNRVNSAVATTAVDDVHLARTLGNRMYQLANHLGNVLSVVTDRKLQVDGNNNNFVDNYLADVLSSTDYYPFGQEMPGRTFSSNRYRYGYNGMEKDDEMKGSGNSYTTDFRMYDPRLGRWMSQDPIVHEWESPYAAFANNPIYFVDPSGLSPNGGEEPIEGTPRKSDDAVGAAGSTAPNGGTRTGGGAVVGGDNVCPGCGPNGEDIYVDPKGGTDPLDNIKVPETVKEKEKYQSPWIVKPLTPMSCHLFPAEKWPASKYKWFRVFWTDGTGGGSGGGTGYNDPDEDRRPARFTLKLSKKEVEQLQELFGGQYKDLKPGKWTYSDKFKSYIPGIPDPKKIAEDQAKEYTIEALRRFIKENENKPVLSQEAKPAPALMSPNDIITNNGDSAVNINYAGSTPAYFKYSVKDRDKRGRVVPYNWDKGKYEYE